MSLLTVAEVDEHKHAFLSTIGCAYCSKEGSYNMCVDDEEYQMSLQFLDFPESITTYAYHVINIIDNVKAYYDFNGEDDYLKEVVLSLDYVSSKSNGLDIDEYLDNISFLFSLTGHSQFVELVIQKANHFVQTESN